jgi:phytoene dehydrogenase-like protein
VNGIDLILNSADPRFVMPIFDAAFDVGCTYMDLERIYGLPEGNPNHGEMTLDQLFYMRPIPGYVRYRTPVAGMYLCGAGTHPGGGVTGIPRQNAAREISKDSK